MITALEARVLFAAPTPLEAEMVTWINADRQDPLAAASRVHLTDLNADLPAGTISSAPKHTLRWNNQLADAASAWADWNFAHGTIQHEGDGTNPFSRVTAAGFPAIFVLENGGLTYGLFSTDAYTVRRVAKNIHDQFVGHAGHRTQLFAEDTREVGISIKTGLWNGVLAEIVFVEMATKKPIDGDFNEDGRVDSLDFNVLVQNYGKTNTPLFSQGNANGDSIIDTIDFNIFAGNYGAVDSL